MIHWISGSSGVLLPLWDRLISTGRKDSLSVHHFQSSKSQLLSISLTYKTRPAQIVQGDFLPQCSPTIPLQWSLFRLRRNPPFHLLGSRPSPDGPLVAGSLVCTWILGLPAWVDAALVNNPDIFKSFTTATFINPSIHRSMGSAPVGAKCPLTSSLWWVSRLLGLALVSWAFARVGVHSPSLRLPYLGVFYSLFFTCHWISFFNF